MAESFAGITVPEGEPETIRDAATTFRGVAGGLHGASSDLRSVPGLVADWQGPASAAFGGTVVTNGSCVDEGAAAMSICAQAAGTYADDLDAAQDDARRAIHDARDAQRRIDAAEADLEAALGAEMSASNAIDSADTQIATSSATGVPDVSAMAARDNAAMALSNAQADAAGARRRLEQAQSDLDDAKRRGHQAEQDARDAARTAAAAFDGVSGHSPAAAVFGGSPTAVEDQVLARVRAGDYSVLDEVPYNYLPEDTQRAIAAEIAKESYDAAYGEGDHSIQEMAGVVRHFQDDDEFATGFYNELGGTGAHDLGTNLIFFNGEGKGLKDPALVALMAPFATLLGTATRSSDLRDDFTDAYLGTGYPIEDRIPGHLQMAAFLMAGPAANYSSNFLSRVGKEILVDSQDTSAGAPPWVELSEYQDFMEFMADNPEAAGELLAGHWGPDNHFSNVEPLLQYSPRYTDGGDALGALIQAGTHDLRGTDLALSNDASHAIIQAVPTYDNVLPDGAKPALVTILDDHIADFDHAAAERAQQGITDPPADGISGLTYEESHDYLKTLVGDDSTRDDATRIVGERVAYDIDRSVVTGDTSYANSAGSLAEMGVLATADADLDSAKTADTMNGLGKSASTKLLALTPAGKLPGFGTIADQALGQVFSTDAVEHALEHQTTAQMDAFGPLKRLAVAAQVNAGQLPVVALNTVDLDGTLNVNFIDGPLGDNDIVMVDPDGDGVRDTPLEWDLDHDGTPERNITERELYDATLGHAEAANQGMTRLQKIVYDGTHPPDIDDLKLPDGLDNDNPSTFEKVWDWPFDAPGEGTISDGSHVVAHQDDLRWDATEGVYHLPVDGAGELSYKRIGEDWVRVEKINNSWQSVE